MTDPTTELIGAGGRGADGELIARLAAANVEPDVLDADATLLAFTLPEGHTLNIIDLVDYGHEPRSKTGGPFLRDVDSFVDYVLDQAEHPDARYYLDLDDIIAVFDDHIGATPGRGGHRATLRLITTDEYDELVAASLDMVPGRDFATWIEDNRHLIIAPDSADIVDLVRNFKATKMAKIEDAVDERSGDVVLHYETTTQLTGELVVPETFTFRVAVFEGQDPIDIVAQFRYDVGDRVKFGFRIPGRDRIYREARAAVAADVAAQLPPTGVNAPTIRNGSPIGPIR